MPSFNGYIEKKFMQKLRPYARRAFSQILRRVLHGRIGFIIHRNRLFH